MHSISTAMPPGSAPAWIVVRAGNGAVKNVAYTSFIAAKSLMSRRYTLHLTTWSSDEPAAWRIARRFSNTRFVSDRTSPSSSFPVRGLMHPWPATKMKSPSITACEYGPIGLGACSVTTAFLIDSSSIVSKGDERGTPPPRVRSRRRPGPQADRTRYRDPLARGGQPAVVRIAPKHHDGVGALIGGEQPPPGGIQAEIARPIAICGDHLVQHERTSPH